MIALSSTAYAQQHVLRIGGGHPTAVTYVQQYESFFIPEVVKRAGEKGHRVRFVSAWGGSVAKLDNTAAAVQSGTLDIGLALPTFEGSRLQLVNFSNHVAFGTTDFQIATEVGVRMARELSFLKEALRASLNIELLGLVPGENYGVNVKFPVTSLDDLRGRRIGASYTTATWVEAIGAVPVGGMIGELYQNLTTGLMEGGVIYKNFIPPFRLDEVSEYWLKTDFGITLSITPIMNLDTRARLPQDLVEIIDEVAQETVYKIAEASASRERESDAYIESKMKVIQLGDDDKRAWAEALKGEPARSAQELDARGLPGTLVFESYLKFLTEAGHVFPVEYPL